MIGGDKRVKITTKRDNREVINYQSYTQHLITVFYNKITAFSSNQYLSQFGLGSVEIRVLAAIASHPLQKAAEICALISIDKAAASRAVGKLESADLINGTTDKPTSKQKRWLLTAQGWEVHNQFLDTVKLRHQRLSERLDEQELEAFNQTLHKLIARVDQLAEK